MSVGCKALYSHYILSECHILSEFKPARTVTIIKIKTKNVCISSFDRAEYDPLNDNAFRTY